MTDLSAFNVTGPNRASKQVSVTFWNAHLRALEDAIEAVAAGSGTGDMLAANNLSDVADAGTSRTNLGLAIGTHVQAYSANLTTYAGIAPSANVQTLLGSADYSAFRTSLGLVIGTNVQAYSANLTTYAGIAPSANVQTILGAADYAAVRTALGLTIGTNVQAYDAELAAIAGLTSAADKGIQFTGAGTAATYDLTAAGKALLDDASATAQRATLGIVERIIIACSDETTPIQAGTAKRTIRVPFTGTLTGVSASVNTAPTGSTIIIDVNRNGTTCLSTKLTIDASEKTSATAATAAVIDTGNDDFTADDEITIDFDQVGSTVAGKGVKVVLTFAV